MIDRRLFIAGVSGAAALPARRASAGPVASAWSRGAYSAIRLVAGGPRAVASGTILAAGLEFEMTRGFHTYWREPGESGVPPMFDWSGSANLAGIEVLWPAPRRFSDASGFFIGYEKALLLPLHVSPKDRARPVNLSLKLDYAVCDTICVPATGEAALMLSPGEGATSRFAGAIEAAEARAPARVRLGETRDGLAILTAMLRPGDPPSLAVTALAPADIEAVELFVEGPAGSMFGRPEATRGGGAGPAARLIVTPLAGRPKAGGRAQVRLTLVAGDRAIETELDLDLPGKTP